MLGGMVMSENIKKSDVKKLYGQLGIVPKSNDMEDYPFFNSKKDEHLAWKPLLI